jgi:hypothetical protein
MAFSEIERNGREGRIVTYFSVLSHHFYVLDLNGTSLEYIPEDIWHLSNLGERKTKNITFYLENIRLYRSAFI